MADYIGDNCRVSKGNIRSLGNGSYTNVMVSFLCALTATQYSKGARRD